ncbi:MAG: electron transfer flavoprotein subunit beta/FixA family protein [Clostridia bacterium]|nr:electron transfer flavoprotein subunit beta/FixA family protein [Clostridia bacterium]
MRILVCVKQVPDTTEVRLREDYTLERDFIAQVMNPADESALEWALQTREKLGGETTVLSMGPERAETTLREAIARGADYAALLTDRRFAGADTLITARCLAAAAKRLGGFDMIVCGRRAVDGETGQVGPMLAALLNIPCVPNVTVAQAGEKLIADQLTEAGVNRWASGYPALLTFCEWSYRLRLPTLSGLRRARQAEIMRLTPDELGLSAEECGIKASPTRVVRVEARPVGVRPCKWMDAEGVMTALMERCPEAMP